MMYLFQNEPLMEGQTLKYSLHRLLQKNPTSIDSDYSINISSILEPMLSLLLIPIKRISRSPISSGSKKKSDSLNNRILSNKRKQVFLRPNYFNLEICRPSRPLLQMCMSMDKALPTVRAEPLVMLNIPIQAIDQVVLLDVPLMHLLSCMDIMIDNEHFQIL